jgi:hypothetical protein
VVERRTAGEQAPEPVTDAEMRFRRHVPEVVGDASSPDGHVAAADAATGAPHGLPPGRRGSPIDLVEGDRQDRIVATVHAAQPCRAAPPERIAISGTVQGGATIDSPEP